MNSYNYRRRNPRYNKQGFITRLKRLSITAWLIIINVIVSIGGFIAFAISESNLDFLALKATSILQGQYLWTLFTHMFVHAGPLHLFVNMFILYSLGSLCEKIIGRKRFLWFYLFSGLFAGALTVVLAGFFGTTPLGARIFGAPDIPMVGASGAIFAIAGLYVILLPRLKFMIIFLPFFSLPAYVMIPLVLFIVWIVSALTGLPIGNVAHFGGLLAGLAYALYLKKKYKRKVKMLQKMFR